MPGIAAAGVVYGLKRKFVLPHFFRTSTQKITNFKDFTHVAGPRAATTGVAVMAAAAIGGVARGYLAK